MLIAIALVFVLWTIANCYLMHVARMRIREGLQQIRCRLASGLVNKDSICSREIQDIVDRIEMVLEF